MKFIATPFEDFQEYALNELYELGFESRRISENEIEVECSEKEFFSLVYFTHFIDRIYYEGQDCVGFSLSSRQFLYSQNSIPPYLICRAIVESKISKEHKIIDPMAGFGEIILETGAYLYNVPLHQRKTTLFETQFTIKPPFIKPTPAKQQLRAVVQDNIEFKKIQENATFFRLKPKCSKFDLEWLDVKYHNNDFDYLITTIDNSLEKEEKKELEKLLFYQAEFITKEKIIVFSQNEIPKSSYQEYVELINEFSYKDWKCYIFE